ncbi:DUF3078 domain-containing protein [candidate division CSSED10-310 bacterium]|uniref:DUF3078 domain-containing protein n=1 Tax=candidate division CSSED10-310 bacterium TaxID=2855610 RepID=A0ABV6Z1F3_UNCC1
MIRKMLIIFLITLLPLSGALGEEEKTDTEQEQGMQYKVMLGANASYNHYDNWTAGGVSTSTFNLLSELAANYKSSHQHEWFNTLKLEYGLTRIEVDDECRKSIDKLTFESKYLFALTNTWKPYLRVAARTQLAKGYEYFDELQSVNLAGESVENVEKVNLTQGFDPFFIEEGAGIAFILLSEEKKSLDFFLGVGGRQLVTSEYYVFSDDETTTALEYILIEDYTDFGTEAGFNLKWVFYENMAFSSNLKFFYALNEGDNDKYNSVTNWENALSLTVNKYVSVTATADMIYDTNVLEMAQWRQVLLVNLTFQLL